MEERGTPVFNGVKVDCIFPRDVPKITSSGDKEKYVNDIFSNSGVNLGLVAPATDATMVGFGVTALFPVVDLLELLWLTWCVSPSFAVE